MILLSILVRYNMGTIKVAKVSFEKNGREYYFSTNNLNLKKNLTVIVETERGLQFGYVQDILEMDASKVNDNLKQVIRICTKNDYNQYLNNVKDSKKAFDKCKMD